MTVQEAMDFLKNEDPTKEIRIYSNEENGHKNYSEFNVPGIISGNVSTFFQLGYKIF